MPSINFNLLLLALLCGSITYFIRLSFIGRKKPVRFSKFNKIILNHIPGACFSALMVSMLIITPTGLNWDFYKIASVIIALIAGLIYKNFITILVSGMTSLWLLKFFLA